MNPLRWFYFCWDFNFSRLIKICNISYVTYDIMYQSDFSVTIFECWRQNLNLGEILRVLMHKMKKPVTNIINRQHLCYLLIAVKYKPFLPSKLYCPIKWKFSFLWNKLSSFRKKFFIVIKQLCKNAILKQNNLKLFCGFISRHGSPLPQYLTWGPPIKII